MKRIAAVALCLFGGLSVLTVALPAPAVADGLAGVLVYAGFQAGPRDDVDRGCIDTRLQGLGDRMPPDGTRAEQEIYTLLRSLIAEGSDAAGKILGAGVPDRVSGVEVVASISGGSGDADIARLTKGSSGSRTLPPEMMFLGLFHLDDVFFTQRRLAGGLTDIKAFTVISFYLYGYRSREVVYAVNFMLPLQLKTENENPEEFFVQTFRNNPKAQESIKGVLPKLAGQILGYQRFKETLSDPLGKSIRKNFVRPRLSLAGSIVNGVEKAGGDARLASRLSQAGGQIAMASLAKDAYALPPYVTEDRNKELPQRDWRERNLYSVILEHSCHPGAAFSRLTGVRATPEQLDRAPSASTTIRTDGGQKIYQLTRNIFPEPVLDAAFDVTSLPLTGKSDVKPVAVSVSVSLRPYCPAGQSGSVCRPFLTTNGKESVAMTCSVDPKDQKDPPDPKNPPCSAKSPEHVAEVTWTSVDYAALDAAQRLIRGYLKGERSFFGDGSLYGSVDEA
ncbi:MAG: hypothetical protein HQL34_12075, partial [Alphaproteobacteria bacterium]|nr:hypothetical protein [Alphaproteobacteria bacterium]